tara:strand:- start:1213 stop:1368 length:156 start_codon:yes stop_codon:yes gene_type:complete
MFEVASMTALTIVITTLFFFFIVAWVYFMGRFTMWAYYQLLEKWEEKKNDG